MSPTVDFLGYSTGPLPFVNKRTHPSGQTIMFSSQEQREPSITKV